MATARPTRTNEVANSSLKLRLVQELIEPDHGHQDQHEERNPRILPGRIENAPGDQAGVAQRTCPKENPSEGHEEKYPELLRQLRHSLAIERLTAPTRG